MLKTFVTSLALISAVLAVDAPASAQAQALPHDSQYPDADITCGATLYAARCVTCHAPRGTRLAA